MLGTLDCKSVGGVVRVSCVLAAIGMIASAAAAEQQLEEQAKRSWSKEVRQAVGFEDARLWNGGTQVASPRKSGTGVVMVRRGDWKLIHLFESGEDELYHTGRDIGETKNIAADYPEMVQELSERILADDMGHGDVQALRAGCKFPTPHLDRLVKEGMAFTQAYSGSSICSPTRYGIMTGRYC